MVGSQVWAMRRTYWLETGRMGTGQRGQPSEGKPHAAHARDERDGGPGGLVASWSLELAGSPTATGARPVPSLARHRRKLGSCVVLA